MCGIAGIVYKDKKLHCAGNDMTNMLHQLQHRGPDSAGYSIYGGTGLKDDEYILKIQVKEQPRLLETVKDTINFVTPIQSDEVLPSVGDSFIYKCKVQLNNFSELKPLISTVDTIDDVIVINGSQDFEMIKDVGSVLDIAKRYNVREVKGTHAIGHTRFSTESTDWELRACSERMVSSITIRKIFKKRKQIRTAVGIRKRMVWDTTSFFFKRMS